MTKTKRAYWKSKSGIMDEYEIITEDLFYYGENANVYLLNYIYQDFFNTTKKVFDPIGRSKED